MKRILIFDRESIMKVISEGCPGPYFSIEPYHSIDRVSVVSSLPERPISFQYDAEKDQFVMVVDDD